MLAGFASVFPSPCGDLVGKVTKEEVEQDPFLGFRPLAGIWWGKNNQLLTTINSQGRVSVPLRGFGGERVTKIAEVYNFVQNAKFPSPCGDLVGKVSGKLAKAIYDKVSVPLRGFGGESGAPAQTVGITSPSGLFPSPCGDLVGKVG